jgi:hypothetical protein
MLIYTNPVGTPPSERTARRLEDIMFQTIKAMVASTETDPTKVTTENSLIITHLGSGSARFYFQGTHEPQMIVGRSLSRSITHPVIQLNWMGRPEQFGTINDDKLFTFIGGAQYFNHGAKAFTVEYNPETGELGNVVRAA